MSTTHEPAPTVRIRHPQDLLALIPHQTGRRPREETVLFLPVPDAGAVCLLVDSPPPEADPSVLGENLVDSLPPVLRACAAVVVVYRDEPADALSALDLSVARLWEQTAAAAGLDLLAVLVVGPRHWWDVEDPEHTRPMSLVEDSPVNAQLIATGSALEPPEPREDPRWATRFEESARELVTAWRDQAREWHDVPAGDAIPGRDDTPGRGVPASRNDAADDAAGRIEAAGDAAADAVGDGVGDAARDALAGEEALAAWERALARVASHREDWVTAVLELPAAELALLLEPLHDRYSRDALLWAWLCGDTSRACSATVGLRCAAAVVQGHLQATDPPAESVEEALRCLAAVAGEWDGPPHWQSLETAHRVLQVLDGITHAPSWAGAATPGAARWLREAPGCVGAVLAQLELFRGRGHTAARILDRLALETEMQAPARAPAVENEAASDVRARLCRQPVPWWCADPRTSWPGRHWWARQGPA